MVFRTASRSLLFAPYTFHYVTQIHGLSASQFGWLQALYYGASVAAEVPTGVLADRLGRRVTLVGSGLAMAAGCAAFALGTAFAHFAAGQLLFALGMTLGNGADSALLFEALASEGRESEYPRAEGRMQGAWLLSSAVGMSAADLFLLRDGNPTAAIWASALLSLAGGLGCIALHEPARSRAVPGAEISGNALRDLLQVPAALRLVVYSVGVFILLRAAIVILYNPVLASAGAPVETWGRILALVNLAGGLAAWRGAHWCDRLGETAMLIALPLLLAAMYAVMIPLHTPLVAAVFLAQGIALGLHPVVVRSGLNRRIGSSERRATLLSLESLCSRLGYSGVSLVVSSVLAAGSLEWAIAAAMALGLAPVAWAALAPWPRAPSDSASRLGSAGRYGA